jgi:predicted metal-dependent RNase|tara:strand:+ start:1068 stop:1376 length:309 start_codon:yes stop_codon:yes gene_type:complete
MDFVALLEQFGIPVVVALAFGFFIWKQNKFIQDELMEELDERFKRLEGIVIKLIDQQKKMQIEQKGIEKSYKALVDIISKLMRSGGKNIKDKFLKILKEEGE